MVLGFSETTGINYPLALSMATVAGHHRRIYYILIARINVKVGARMLSGVCLICAGLSYIFLGHSTTLVTYCIALTLVTCFMNGAAYTAGNTLIAQWFPKKKGLANGFTTMGHNCGSAFYVPLVSMTVGTLGFVQEAATGLMSACALIGVVGSYRFDSIDQKFGIKKDILLFLAWYCVALAIQIAGSLRGVYMLFIGLLVVNMLIAPCTSIPPSTTRTIPWRIS